MYFRQVQWSSEMASLVIKRKADYGKFLARETNKDPKEYGKKGHWF